MRNCGTIGLIFLFFTSSCAWRQQIKDGVTAYEQKQFAVAISLLEKELSEETAGAARGKKYYLLGNSYMKLLQYKDAVDAYRKATSFGYGPEALSGQARAHKSLEEYQEAVVLYRQLGEKTGKKLEADRDILLCQQAIEAKKRKTEYQIEKVFENTEVSDYAPALFEDRFLVFTSERKEATGNDVYNWTGEKFSDLFIMSRSGSDVQKFDAFLNTASNEGAAWFTSDMQRVYFTRCTGNDNADKYCQIYFSDRETGVWTEPSVMPFTLDGINYGHPTLLENDSVLVFSSDLAEPGGSRDLYYSVLSPSGAWTAPDAMPAAVNTQGNEVFPTGDGDTLYFSSDYLPGLGGFDIFKTFLRSDGSWSPAENMGYPINSGGDDFSFIIDYAARTRPRIRQQGFFVSSRDGERKDDLYRFAKLIIEPAPVDSTLIPVVKKNLFLVIRAFEPVYKVADDPNSGVIGRDNLGIVRIALSESNSGKKTESVSDGSGFYFSEVSPQKQYQIVVSKQGYLSSAISFDGNSAIYQPGETSLTINREVLLEKIYPLKEIRLENIYYEFDSWEILSEAKPSLDRLVNILVVNPSARIQLTSHTDCRGEEEYNQALSQRRAQSAVDYLISKGIAADRLVAVGMGESALVETCPCDRCSEEEHQANRRTTFMILP